MCIYVCMYMYVCLPAAVNATLTGSTIDFYMYLYLYFLPAAVNATLTGSTIGAGAPETERRQHARARTTKPFGLT